MDYSISPSQPGAPPSEGGQQGRDSSSATDVKVNRLSIPVQEGALLGSEVVVLPDLRKDGKRTEVKRKKS